MSIKCSYCKKEIKGRGLLLNSDGDFVCDSNCKELFHKEMDRVCSMTDNQFKRWMLGEDFCEVKK